MEAHAKQAVQRGGVAQDREICGKVVDVFACECYEPSPQDFRRAGASLERCLTKSIHSLLRDVAQDRRLLGSFRYYDGRSGEGLPRGPDDDAVLDDARIE